MSIAISDEPLYLQLFVRGLMSYLCYLCLFAYSGVQHILCSRFFFSLRLVYTMLSVSLDCPLLIAPLVFSYVHCICITSVWEITLHFQFFNWRFKTNTWSTTTAFLGWPVVFHLCEPSCFNRFSAGLFWNWETILSKSCHTFCFKDSRAVSL